MEKKLIFIGLSGGVDSAVSAARLLRLGHRVVGVFIRVWHPDFIRCTEEDDRIAAMRVAAHLKIPFLTYDARDVYKRDVAEHMIGEYAAGRTPNPDVMCNQAVKFGAFYRFARAHGADSVATGHYARVGEDEKGRWMLEKGIDTAKDQSYFLWTLPQDILPHVLFPIGNSTKKDVRAEALSLMLPNARRADSQGICFLGNVDMHDFLSHYIPLQKGLVLSEAGDIIGEHDGALTYTYGQRHGFRITNSSNTQTPLYVAGKDIHANTLTVSNHKRNISADSLLLGSANFYLPLDELMSEQNLTACFRYHQTPVSVSLRRRGRELAVFFTEATDRPSPGQSAVFYVREHCVGGGIIES